MTSNRPVDPRRPVMADKQARPDQADFGPSPDPAPERCPVHDAHDSVHNGNGKVEQQRSGVRIQV